ncbi:hypothetical protein Strvi_4944 [Streptomyces violaceusniger Tu 4113]|uniref:Alanine-rich protein n=1 Tax=Streptomyces violaceusniger (strain Tu 4113) TaxID=653045 RepID=G2P5A4_STRV4|nr:hypothetical protein Strvi_4944 [Streptomyces violaceusniger Tu 4113]
MRTSVPRATRAGTNDHNFARQRFATGQSGATKELNHVTTEPLGSCELNGTFAYTWDLVGDPAAADRLASLGVGAVVLQAAYHSVRAMTPYHPAHRIVHATHAAAYFPLDPHQWRDTRLRPSAPGWAVDAPDRFGTAASALRSQGLRVEAWLVLTHSTAVGAHAPDLTVRNAFDERYGYALCPAQPEVTAYAVQLVRAFCARYDAAEVPSLMLEACGWLGFEHGSRHEKTAGADLSAGCRDLLSICLCAACRTGIEAAGADPAGVARAVRRTVDAEMRDGVRAPSAFAESLGEQAARALLRHRQSVIEELTLRIAAAAPGREILLMADGDPQATGPDSGLDLGHFDGRATAFVLKCWDDEARAVARIEEAVRSSARPVIANVSVLEEHPAHLAGRVARLRAAGAQRIRYYHAGLASPARLQALRAADAQGEVIAMTGTTAQTAEGAA